MTTLDHPEDHPTQPHPKITEDETVNAIREARTLLETVSINTVATRHALQVTHDTVHVQAKRIAELEKDNSNLEAALHRVNKEREEMRVAIEELEYNGDMMHKRLTAHSEARSHGKYRVPENWKIMHSNGRMAEEFADLISNAREKGKMDWIDIERERTNRIARGIRNRIKDGHTAIALLLVDALTE
jgi:hypothetical protein